MPGSGLEVRVESQDLSALYRAAKAADGQIQVQLRRGIKKAAEPVKRGVQEAAGFSSRIPGAVKTKASFAARGASVTVYVDGSKAPEAAPINNKGRSGKFRHPNWGNRNSWSEQTAIPFMTTGARAGEPGADAAMLQVMDDIAHALGFH